MFGLSSVQRNSVGTRWGDWVGSVATRAAPQSGATKKQAMASPCWVSQQTASPCCRLEVHQKCNGGRKVRGENVRLAWAPPQPYPMRGGTRAYVCRRAETAGPEPGCLPPAQTLAMTPVRSAETGSEIIACAELLVAYVRCMSSTDLTHVAEADGLSPTARSSPMRIPRMRPAGLYLADEPAHDLPAGRRR